MTTMSTARLTAALALSSFALVATSGGAWPLALSSLLWSSPVLIAARCLPLGVALPLIVVTGTVGRAIAWHGGLTGAELLLTPLLATLAILPAVAVDKLLVDKLPRASFLWWPVGLAVTTVLLRLLVGQADDRALAGMIVAPPDLAPLQAFAARLGDAGPVFLVGFVGLVAQGFAALGSVLNRAHDPVSVDEREAGVRWSAIVTLGVSALVLVVGALL